MSMLSAALQSLLLQITHLFSPPWSPCLPSHLQGILLCVSRGVIWCQEQNLSLELQPPRFSLIPFPRPVGTQPLELGPILWLPKGHLTRQLGLLQHCCPEGLYLCFLLNSLLLVKEMSQSHVLTTPGFRSPVCVICVFAPIWGGEQWNLSCCSPGGHHAHQEQL